MVRSYWTASGGMRLSLARTAAIALCGVLTGAAANLPASPVKMNVAEPTTVFLTVCGIALLVIAGLRYKRTPADQPSVARGNHSSTLK